MKRRSDVTELDARYGMVVLEQRRGRGGTMFTRTCLDRLQSAVPQKYRPRSHFTVTNACNGMYRDWKRCTAMGRVPRGASRNVLAVYKDLVQARLVTMAMQCGLLPFRLALRPEVL